MAQERYADLKKAEQGAIVSIVAYIFVSAMKLAIGSYANSKALSADGLNNFTDIIASVTVLIGLKIAQKPADGDHRYGHWKAENVASMVTSFIMLMVGLQVLSSAIQSILNNKMDAPDILAAVVGIVSAIIMYGVYFYNKKLSEQVNSPALLAAAKDNRSDAWTSIGTAVAVFAASFNLGWLDSLAAVVVALLILKTAIDIFRESAFSLSDGFDEELLENYAKAIRQLPEVKEIRSLRGRSYGANVFLDIVVAMDPTLNLRKSHEIADSIEELLKSQFQVYDVDVHVEPYAEPLEADFAENEDW